MSLKKLVAGLGDQARGKSWLRRKTILPMGSC